MFYLIRDLLWPPVKTVTIESKLVHPNAQIPFRKRATDAGYDLYSVEHKIIPAGDMVNIRTGIILTCPPGWYMTIEPRSSLAIRKISPFHAIIDATYTGEMMVALMNHGSVDYEVHDQDRIAQVVLHRQCHLDFKLVEEFSNEYSGRGLDGFGHSGR